ncbi:hypothetical protein Pfo_025763, partial [Paulownia fortunei]
WNQNCNFPPFLLTACTHLHYGIQSHPSELASGFLPIARMFGRNGFTMEMQDAEVLQITRSPEGFLEQLLFTTRVCDVPFQGENSAMNLDDASFQQLLKMSKVLFRWTGNTIIFFQLC